MRGNGSISQSGRMSSCFPGQSSWDEAPCTQAIHPAITPWPPPWCPSVTLGKGRRKAGAECNPVTLCWQWAFILCSFLWASVAQLFLSQLHPALQVNSWKGCELTVLSKDLKNEDIIYFGCRWASNGVKEMYASTPSLSGTKITDKRRKSVGVIIIWSCHGNSMRELGGELTHYVSRRA